MSFYVLRAAAKTNIYEAQFDKLMQRWRKMMGNNLTTWAEGDIMFRSDCHGWSSSPVYENVHEIFGVNRRKGPGKLRIAPRYALQEEASETPVVVKEDQGDINVDVAFSNIDGKLVVSASRKLEATLVLKNGRMKIVTLGSQPVVEEI